MTPEQQEQFGPLIAVGGGDIRRLHEARRLTLSDELYQRLIAALEQAVGLG